MLQILARVFGERGWQTEAALLQRYDVTVHASAFPVGDEVIGLGILLQEGDTIADVYVDISTDPVWDGSNNFVLGRAPIQDAADLYNGSGNIFPQSTPNIGDNDVYGGTAGAATDVISSVGYDGTGRGGFVPVKVAHELSLLQQTSMQATTGSLLFSVFVLPAAARVVLPDVT